MLAGVVIRLTSTMSSSHSMPGRAFVAVAVLVAVLVLVLVVVVAVVVLGFADEVRRQEQLHAALRAVAGLRR